MSHAKLILIRHGSTAMNNSADLIRGWKDVPLDDKGREEATNAGNALSAMGLEGIITSDLSRAEDTGRIIADILKIPVLSHEYGLRPWNLGYFTGQAADKVMPEIKYYIDNPDIPIMWGESFNTFRERFLSTIISLDQQYAGCTIGIVTHHRGDRLLAAWNAAGCPSDYTIDLNIFMKHGIEPGTARVIPVTEIQRVEVLTKQDSPHA